MRLLHMTIVFVIAATSILVWWGIGHGVAWLLDAGLNVDVNKGVFTKAGLIVGSVQATIALFVGVIQNRLLKKWE